MSTTARQRNLRALLNQWGGGEALAKRLGYSGASYLSQMVTGHRPITEKTARKIEQSLSLPVGWLDGEHATEDARPPPLSKVNASLFSRVVVTVSAQMSEMGINLNKEKFEEVVSFVYDSAVTTGKVDAALVQRVLMLAA